MAENITLSLNTETTRKLALLSLRLKKPKSELVRDLINQAYRQYEDAAAVESLPEAA